MERDCLKASSSPCITVPFECLVAGFVLNDRQQQAIVCPKHERSKDSVVDQRSQHDSK